MTVSVTCTGNNVKGWGGLIILYFALLSGSGTMQERLLHFTKAITWLLLFKLHALSLACYMYRTELVSGNKKRSRPVVVLFPL